MEPRQIDPTSILTPRSVQDALMETARSAIGGHFVAMIGAGLVAVFVLVMSLWHVGARAPVDLPILCVAVAFTTATLAAFLTMRERAAFIERVTAQDLIGVTQNTDKSLWLHVQNRRAFRTPAPSVAGSYRIHPGTNSGVPVKSRPVLTR